MVCYHCDHRKPGCHAKCIDYAAYVETLSQRGRKAEQDYTAYLSATKKRIERIHKTIRK